MQHKQHMVSGKLVTVLSKNINNHFDDCIEYTILTTGHLDLARMANLDVILLYCVLLKVFVSTALMNPLPATALYVMEDANFTAFK